MVRVLGLPLVPAFCRFKCRWGFVLGSPEFELVSKTDNSLATLFLIGLLGINKRDNLLSLPGYLLIKRKDNSAMFT